MQIKSKANPIALRCVAFVRAGKFLERTQARVRRALSFMINCINYSPLARVRTTLAVWRRVAGDNRRIV